MSEFLIVMGAVLQASGFVLALLDLRHARQQVTAYESRPQVIEAGTAFEAEVAFPVGMVTSGEEPTLDQRIELLERAIEQEQADRAEAARNLRRQMQSRLDQVATTVERSVRREVEALAGLTAARPRWVQWWAIGLFITGLALMTIGSLIG